MKKLACLTLGFLMLLGLCACGGEVDNPQTTTAPVIQNPTELSQATQPPVETTEALVAPEQELFFVSVDDEDYPNLLQGGLTKEQLAAFLWLAPSNYSGLALSADTVSHLVNGMANASDVLALEVGTNENWQQVCSVKELNRILSILTDCQISEETHPDQVDGDSYTFYGAGGRGSSVTITSAKHNGVEMRIAYTYQNHGPAPVDEGQEEERIAILKVNDDGLYQITNIGKAEDIKLMESLMSSDSPAWKRAYMRLLSDAPNMSFTASDNLHVSKKRAVNYRLADLDGNGTPELILQATSSEEGSNILSFRNSWVGVYTFTIGEAQLLYSDIYYQPGFVWDDSTESLIIYRVDAFNGNATYYALTVENGAVQKTVIFEGKFSSLDGASKYNADHGYVSLPSAEFDDFSLLINN